jgi:hypothetical protein
MALAGILSSHIIHQQFVEDFSTRPQVSIRPDLIVDKRAGQDRHVGTSSPPPSVAKAQVRQR